MSETPRDLYDVAVVGMAGRFRDAPDVEALWRNLERGHEAIAVFSDRELTAAGVDPELLRRPEYVKARGMLQDAECLDAAFFGISPREAELRDPQHRLFLECAFEALEDGACDPARFAGPIGVFGGCSSSSYLTTAFLGGALAEDVAGSPELTLGNDPHFLATFVSYQLDLKGPSLTVATACSTSLVAVHLACQSLLQGECDAALAGGVTVDFPRKQGYLYQEGSINSPDGHCRAFDARGQGTVAGEGVGVVFLKRLRDALEDGDPIRALIKGSAVNNDGRGKIGFSAPSVEGQSAVIAEAHAMAGVDAETLTFLEAHGSGTPLGDPVEVKALTRAFRQSTERTGFCALGSIKTNLGHLDSAAGVAGLIKTVLALEHRRIPPTLHFERPNPTIDFAASPFYVNTEAIDWPAGGAPRRAGVSSLGMGGTNVHAVLEEAPEREPTDAGRGWHLLTLSAASESALERLGERLARALSERPELPLADVAYTTQTGRRVLGHRRVAVCRDRGDALDVLAGGRPERRWTRAGTERSTSVAFLFPGVGDHYPGMARGLYASEEVFRREIDRGARTLEPLLGTDPRRSPLLAGDHESAAEPAAGLDLRRMAGRGGAVDADAPWNRPAFLHPVVVLVEVALSRLWESWGILPRAVAGYSLGEITAAAVAGTFSLPDALRLAFERARAIERVAGAMLAVPLPESELEPLLGSELALAAVNAPELCVLSGSREAVDALERRLAARETVCRRLDVGHPLHSPRMAPAARELVRLLQRLELKPPEVPWVSGVTGDWITPAQATDPETWARHLCRTVRFADALAALDAGAALVEVGPGHGLTTLVLQQVADGRTAVASLPPVYAREDDLAFLLGSLGRLWLAGVEVDWSAFHAGARRRRVSLPAHPFERRRYSLLPEETGAAGTEAPSRPAAPSYTAPSSPQATASEFERALAGDWRRLLRLERVGLHDSFFALGGHSLLAPQLLLEVRRRYGVDVPLAYLLAKPTVAELAAAVERLRAGEDREALLDAEGSDGRPLALEREARLDPTIVPEFRELAGDPADPEAVLLTGASGFLGAFLLRDLLAATRARVHCLVRAASLTEAAARIRRNLESYGLWDDAWKARVVPVTGDLAAPSWGLPEGVFHALAHTVEAVYHCGAWVNFTYPYSALKAANVGGTAGALRLAALGRLKPVHFVSTLAVYEVAPAPGGDFLEVPAPAPGGAAVGGYPASKWVAEKLVEEGRARGIPAVIYRPGIIGGDSAGGIGNGRDLTWSFLKGCLQMGAAPEVEAAFDPAPVDYVSRALVHLSLRRSHHGATFHLNNPARVAWPEVFRFARELGYRVRFQPWEAWREALVETLEGPGENALRPFWNLLVEALDAERSGGDGPSAASGGEVERLERELRFDCRRTLAALEGSSIRCPPPDRDLLETYFAAWLERGFLPPPAATAGTTPRPTLEKEPVET